MKSQTRARRTLVAILALGSVAAPIVATPAHAGTQSRRYIAAGGTPFAGDSPLAPCDPGGFDPSISGACFAVPSGVTVTVDIRDDILPWVVAYYDVDGGLTAAGFLCGGGVISVPGDGVGHAVGIWVGGADIVQGTGCMVQHGSTGQATTGSISISF
jgi:hypothetical protein